MSSSCQGKAEVLFRFQMKWGDGELATQQLQLGTG